MPCEPAPLALAAGAGEAEATVMPRFRPKALPNQLGMPVSPPEGATLPLAAGSTVSGASMRSSSCLGSANQRSVRKRSRLSDGGGSWLWTAWMVCSDAPFDQKLPARPPASPPCRHTHEGSSLSKVTHRRGTQLIALSSGASSLVVAIMPSATKSCEGGTARQTYSGCGLACASCHARR